MILNKFINFLSKLQKIVNFSGYNIELTISDPLCSFCKNENENMIHLLLECENVQILLEALDNWTLTNDNFTLNYYKKTFLLGYHKEKNSLISNTIY